MPYEKKNNVYIQTSISIHIFIVAQICTYVVDIRSFNILPRVQHPSDWYGLAICCYSTRISFCKYSHSAAIYWIGITSGWSLRKCWPTARLRTPYSQTGMHCGLYRVDSSQDKTRQDKTSQTSLPNDPPGLNESCFQAFHAGRSFTFCCNWIDCTLQLNLTDS